MVRELICNCVHIATAICKIFIVDNNCMNFLSLVQKKAHVFHLTMEREKGTLREVEGMEFFLPISTIV